MKIVVALLQLCFWAPVTAEAVSGNGSSTETTMTAAPGDIALLPCYTDSNDVTPVLTKWYKDELEVIRGGVSLPSPSSEGQRLEVLRDGSLNIKGVTPGDKGSYLCASNLLENITYRAHVLLQVTALGNVSVSIHPSTALPNGTLYVYRGSTVSFNCSGPFSSSQQLTWAFTGASNTNSSLVSTSGSSLDFRIEDIQPTDQGVYTCRALHNLSHQAVNTSTELLVYYAPDRHPECSWAPGPDPSHVPFSCTWLGAYPTATLCWGEEHDVTGGGLEGHVYVSAVTNSLSITMNRSILFDGQTLGCTAEHVALPKGTHRTCSITIKPPVPEVEPMVSVLDGSSSVTLLCTEAVSTPPANTTWRKGLQQEVITAGEKYTLTEEGPVLKLTIHNITKDDEGVFFCRSENPLAIREQEVYLTVRTSSPYTGAIIGIFVAALIVGSAAIIAKTVYSSRHKICLGSGFGQMEEERGDVFSLVESDDEQIFQDSVPRLPPVTNGHQTTLVQIHRIPSSDHEEAEAAGVSSQQQEDTVQTEEPVELVTF